MKHSFKTTSLFSYSVFSGNLSDLQIDDVKSSKILVNTINPHSFYVANHDPDFKNALTNSTILLPDGVGIVFANWLINGFGICKISGTDLFYYLLRSLDQSKKPEHKRVFLLGTTNENLNVMVSKMKTEFPSLQVEGYSPPFRSVFSELDSLEMCEQINSFTPFLLLVGMTAPKQEKWVYQNKDRLSTSIVCSVGAVFDFYTGRIKRPNKLWQKLWLEWFGRFSREPKRLWKRNLISLPYFIIYIFREVFKKIYNKIGS